MECLGALRHVVLPPNICVVLIIFIAIREVVLVIKLIPTLVIDRRHGPQIRVAIGKGDIITFCYRAVRFGPKQFPQLFLIEFVFYIGSIFIGATDISFFFFFIIIGIAITVVISRSLVSFRATGHPGFSLALPARICFLLFFQGELGRLSAAKQRDSTLGLAQKISLVLQAYHQLRAGAPGGGGGGGGGGGEAGFSVDVYGIAIHLEAAAIRHGCVEPLLFLIQAPPL